MIYVVGASSIHHALYPKKCTEAELVQLADSFRQHAISKPSVNLHPQAANQHIPIQLLLLDLGPQVSCVIWHDVINNTVTENPSKTRKELTLEQLLDGRRPQPKTN